MLQLKKIEGIVINETNYSESSKILTIYTKENGLISVISKGCRKIKSALRSISTKFIHAEFVLNYKESALSNLISADIINDFRNILSDINKISYSTYILELTSQVAKQNDNSEIFDLLINGLKKIDEGIDSEAITLILELKYLKYLGIDISIDNCSNCGSNTSILTLSSDKGGYICKDCYENEKIVTEKTIKVIRLLYYLDITKLNKLVLANQTIKEIGSFLEEYYDKYSGLYLKSRNFLKIINN